MGDFEAIINVPTLRDGADGQLHWQHDGGQSIVEFVGHLPGRFADRFNNIFLPSLW